MIEPKLHPKVLDLLGARPRTTTYSDVAEATGLNEAWIKQFAAGNIPNPSVNRVETLYVYLTGNALNV